MIKKIKESKMLQTLLYILIIFVLYLSFWNDSLFGSDEEEIFIKGQQMALGKRLYAEVITQHMPIMYHFAAIFAKLGVSTIAGFRGSFYLLFSILWGIIYYYFAPKIGRVKVILTPIIYFIVISGIGCGTCILSDHIQAIGVVIIFYEMLLFYENRRVGIKDSIMLSLGIFISFNAAFISLFPIFAAFVFVLVLEIRQAQQDKRSILTELIFLIKKYFVMLVIILAPNLCLWIYYWQRNMFLAFVKWGYLFNTDVYARYIGGYGDNPISALFKGIGTLMSSFNFDTFTSTTISNIFFMFVVLLYLINEYRTKKDKLYMAGILFFLVTCASRSTFGFHGLSAISTMSVMASIVICDNFNLLWDKVKDSTVKIALVILAVIFLSCNYLTKIPNSLSFTTKEYIKTSSLSYALEKITDKNEEIGMATLDYTTLIQAGVVPYSLACGAFAWYWEWTCDEELSDYSNYLPRVFYYDPNYAVWGYPITSYAPELKQIIEQNYRSVDEYSGLYVLNSYYDEAMSKLNESVIYENTSSDGVVAALSSGVTIEQKFSATDDKSITHIKIMFGTYARENDCNIVISIVDDDTKEARELVNESAIGFADNAYKEFYFEEYDLIAGHRYTILINSPDADEENYLAVYGSNESSAKNEVYINGAKQDVSLCISIETDGKILPIVENVVE